jgi:hypothetical protein
MADYTPGPWSVNDETETRSVYAGEDVICDVHDPYEGFEGDSPEAEANARLIAAAPDLFAVCEALLGELDTEGFNRLIFAAEAAVAKATLS